MSKLLNPKGILLVSMPIKNLNNLSKKLLLIDIIENTYIYGKKIKGGGRPTMSSNEYRNYMHHMSFYDNPYSQSTNYGIPNEQLQYHNQQLEQQNKIIKIDEKDDINKKIDDLARRIKEELKS